MFFVYDTNLILNSRLVGGWSSGLDRMTMLGEMFPYVSDAPSYGRQTDRGERVIKHNGGRRFLMVVSRTQNTVLWNPVCHLRSVKAACEKNKP